MLPSRSVFRPPAHRGYPDTPQASQAFALDPPSVLALQDPGATTGTSLSQRTVEPGGRQQGDGKTGHAEAIGAKRKTQDEPPDQDGVQARDSKIARSGSHTDPTAHYVARSRLWERYQTFLGYRFAPGDEPRQLASIVSATIGRLGGMHISDADLWRVLRMMRDARPDVKLPVGPIAAALGGHQMPLRRLEVFFEGAFNSYDVSYPSWRSTPDCGTAPSIRCWT